MYLRKIDGWLIEKLDDVAGLLQRDDGYHYADIIGYSGVFLCAIATVAVFAQYSPGSPLFLLAFLPYIPTLAAMVGVAGYMRREKRLWNVRRVEKWTKLSAFVREKLFPMRVVSCLWLISFTVFLYVIPTIFSGDVHGLYLAIALVRNLAITLVKIGTVVMFLYIACISPTLPEVKVSRKAGAESRQPTR